MKAVLLAAGFGKRLRPLTDSVPKCLVPLAGRPLLDYWLESLTEAGIGRFLVNTHYLPDAVRAYVATSPYRSHVTLVHEPDLLGTAGTLLANREFVGRATALLAHADNVCLCDFRAFVEAHERRPASAVMTMMTFETPTPESCGIVELDAQGLVVGFHEKVANPPGRLANGAVYIIEPEVVDFIATLHRRVVDFSLDVIPHFVGRILAWQNRGVHHDIGTYEGLAAAEASVLRASQVTGRR